VGGFVPTQRGKKRKGNGNSGRLSKRKRDLPPIARGKKEKKSGSVLPQFREGGELPLSFIASKREEERGFPDISRGHLCRVPNEGKRNWKGLEE